MGRIVDRCFLWTGAFFGDMEVIKRILSLFIASMFSLSSLGVRAQDSCLSSQDCGSGEVCVFIRLGGGGDVVSHPHTDRGTCDPAGCQADSDCGADEKCIEYGAGIPNKCGIRPDPDTSGGTVDDLGGTPPVATPPIPVTTPPSPPSPPPSPPAPPPPKPQPPPTKPKTAQVAKPIKVNVVIRGNVDSRTLAQTLSKLTRELDKSFGKKGTNYELTIRSPGDPPENGPRNFTLYVVSGTDAPTDIWPAHGYKVSADANKSLGNTFDPSNATTGVTLGNVSIISTDKAIGQGGFSFSNAMTHELGHGLLGPQCAGHPASPQCGAVMQANPPPSQDLGYTPEFVDTVRQIYPLLVDDLPRYTAVWQPGTEGEIQLYGWTTDALRTRYDELWREGWRLKLLNSFVLEGEVRYAAVFKPGQEGEIQIFDVPFQNFKAKYDELWSQGWRLKQISPYVLNNQVRYTAVWEPSAEDEIQLYEVTTEALRSRYDQLWREGWRLKLLSPYVLNGEVRYVAVFKPSQEGEIQVYDWSYNDYRAEYDRLWEQGWRLKLLSPYAINNQVFYTAVWRPGTEGEIQVYGWHYEDYRAEYDKLWEHGWRLKVLVPH